MVEARDVINAYMEQERLPAERLRRIERRLHDNLERVADAIIDIGRCLNEAKEARLVPHGQWEAWVREHAQMSPQAAQRAMKAAREIPDDSRLARLPFSKVMELMALPADTREGFAAEVDAESLTVKELRAAVKAEKARADALERGKAEYERKVLADMESTAVAIAQAQVEDAVRERCAELEVQLRDRQQELEAANAANNDLRQEIIRAGSKLESARSIAKTNAGALTEVARLERELAELREEMEAQEAEIERRAEAEKAAKQELLRVRAQAVRGGAAESEQGKVLTPADLSAAALAFIGVAGALPHMSMVRCDEAVREQYRTHVRMIRDWAEASERALDAEGVLEL